MEKLLGKKCLDFVEENWKDMIDGGEEESMF